MVWTNETRPICGAGPLDSLARAALPRKLAGRSDLHQALIVLTMFLLFHRQVLPNLPGRIGESYDALAATTAALGGVAVFAGFYLLLAAGTNLLPEKFRIKSYKFWMRTVLFIRWMVLFLGMGTYARC